MVTFGYKGGFIHENFTAGIIQVQVTAYSPPVYVKSIQAAKAMITKYQKSVKGA